jgi:3-phenylpropionate/trans-cinnamate dioxygenase ferredoxin component
MGQWIAACDAEDVDPEDVIPFDHSGNAYAVYRSPDDEYYATDSTAPTNSSCSATASSCTARSPNRSGPRARPPRPASNDPDER